MKKLNQLGFTLFEVLISMSIAVVVGGLLLLIMVNSVGLFYNESSKVNIGLNTNDALNQVRKNIKESSGVAASYTAGSTTYSSGGTQAVLKVPSLDLSGNIITNTFDYFVFFQDALKLRFKTFPNALSSRKAQDQIFTTSLDKLVFQYLNSANPPVEVAPISATKVKITLTLKQKAGAAYQISTATSEANLRND